MAGNTLTAGEPLVRAFCKTHLTDIMPCNIANKDNVDGFDEDLYCVTTDLDMAKQLAACCAKYKAAPEVIFHLAWAVTMRHFVKSDNICFGVLEESATEEGRKASVSKTSATIATHFAKLDGHATVAQALQELYAKSHIFQDNAMCSREQIENELDIGMQLYDTLICTEQVTNERSDSEWWFPSRSGKDVCLSKVGSPETANIRTFRRMLEAN